MVIEFDDVHVTFVTVNFEKKFFKSRYQLSRVDVREKFIVVTRLSVKAIRFECSFTVYTQPPFSCQLEMFSQLLLKHGVLK